MEGTRGKTATPPLKRPSCVDVNENTDAMRELEIVGDSQKMTFSSLEYPEFFELKLRTNKKLRSGLDSSLSVVADVLQVSKLPFFLDYTGHGVQHLANLLGIAERLIPDRARNLFSAEDAAVLIFSVLLHDLALHISEAGFLSLLNSTQTESKSKWNESWAGFLAVARHWDDRKLVELFGADEGGAPRALVRNPLDHYDDLTESDRKLIGEFIRQHHAEFAYQFAVLGFPGPNGQLIQFGDFDLELRKLAGSVARSHGFPLRDCVQLLEVMQVNKLEHDDVHPVFLMGILRVADFLELGTDRAPLIAFAYKEFKSPVSQKEWRTNQAFRKISWGNPDPESIHIPAKPTDVWSFLDLTRWLAAIQSELDTTWAVFGEVYGSHQKFSQLGLTIRRVRSNVIDDFGGFAKNSSFVPMRVELGVASPDVLKLFIQPLYGERPEFGIRELIQNAVDAVRERWEYVENHEQFASSQSRTQEADVIVWLDDPDENGVALLTVSDNGIGMTEETVVNYFLKAGASFRRSIAWKKEFESKTSETPFKSRVLRSGRFGIGVLSAFLLGDDIEVLTRHVTRDRGIRFSARLDLLPPALEITPIQLNYEADLPVGTTVKVKVTKIKNDPEGTTGTNILTGSDLWDWYCLESPSVMRLQGRDRKMLKQSTTLPSEESPLPRGWHRLASSDYRTVHTLVQGTSGTNAPDLVCNGLKVRETSTGFLFRNDPAIVHWKRDLFPDQGAFSLKVPDFSVFDPDGNLPLNLQRTGLTNMQLDFLTEAFAAQTRSALAKFVLSAPTEPAITDEFHRALTDVFAFEQAIPAFFTNMGTALLTTTNLRSAGVRSCLLVSTEALTGGWLSHVQDRYNALAVARWGYHHSSPLYALNEWNPWIGSARVITRSDEEPIVGKPLRFRYKEFADDGFRIYRTANCAPTLLKREDIEVLRERFPSGEDKELKSAKDFIAAELFLKDPLPQRVQSELSVGRSWEQIIREPVVPFSVNERQSRLKHVYHALSEYLDDFVDK